jgi:predicted GNAT family N-acyltransferase
MMTEERTLLQRTAYKEKRLIRTIVVSTEIDRHTAFHLRYQVYIAEQQKAYVHADHHGRVLRDDADHYPGVCLLITVNDIPAATVRATHLEDDTAFNYYNPQFELDRNGLTPRMKMVVCSRLAVLPQYRKTDVVHTVMEEVYRYEARRGVRFCFQYCVPRLVPFFKRYGFCEYAKPVADATLGQAHRMKLVLDDLDHLRNVRSPFLAAAAEMWRDRSQ